MVYRRFVRKGCPLKTGLEHTGIKNLTKTLAKRSPQLIVLEATGGHEYAAACALMKAGLPVAVVNPRQVRDFARAVGKLAKTDPIDARILAHFGEAVQPACRSRSGSGVGGDQS